MIDSIVKAVGTLNEEKAISLSKYYLHIGEDPLNIINAVQVGMFKVGELYQKREFFLADLIMAGLIFKEILALDEMNLSINETRNIKVKPTILIGTIKDDLHDIGKAIFSGMAIASGYRVIDLGVDVSPEVFLNSYYKYKPDVIAVSGVLTESIKNMKELVDLFKEKGEREKVKIIIGGHPITEEAYKYIGADAYSIDIRRGIEICDRWIKNEGF